jgi:DNA polymerase III delta prime subunit
MNHIKAIKQLIGSISKSESIHAIIIEGPPGWGKTTAVDLALKEAVVESVHLGAYSTPLNLFNFLFENQDKFIVIDDTSGLFIDSASMAILKAATWQQGGKRAVRWGSTSSRAATPDFDFAGKFIIVCNSFPETPDGEAIKSRSYLRPIHITLTQARNLLLEAAQNSNWYENTHVAKNVAEFLVERLTDGMVSKISYRTLQMGYELAKDHPDNWQELLLPTIPKKIEDPYQFVKSLGKMDLKVKEQVRIFEETTGLKRRTFFKIKSEANQSRLTHK